MIEKSFNYYPKTKQLPPKTKKVGKYNRGGPVQLEFDFEENPGAEIIDFNQYVKPGMPIYEWWRSKAKTKENIKLASVDDIAPYLSEFFSQKQLNEMTEPEMLKKLEELLELKQI